MLIDFSIGTAAHVDGRKALTFRHDRDETDWTHWLLQCIDEVDAPLFQNALICSSSFGRVRRFKDRKLKGLLEILLLAVDRKYRSACRISHVHSRQIYQGGLHPCYQVHIVGERRSLFLSSTDGWAAASSWPASLVSARWKVGGARSPSTSLMVLLWASMMWCHWAVSEQLMLPFGTL